MNWTRRWDTLACISATDVSRSEHAPAGIAEPAVVRPRLVEAGVGLLAFAAPLAFLPMSHAPFVDVKLVLVAVATLLVWAGGGPRDRTLARLAGIWIAVTAVAGALGVDRWWSVLGPENLGSGLIMFVPCAALLALAPAVGPALAARIPRWLLWSGVAASAVAIGYRFAPEAFDAVLKRLPMDGGTLGHPVLLSGLCALGLAAVAGQRGLVMGPRLLAALIVVSSGLAISTKRAGWVAVVAGVAIAVWRGRPGRRHGLVVAGTIAATLIGWSVVDVVAPSETGVSAIRRFDDLGSDSARARIEIHKALLRAWAERPLLGWGPGNTWGAYLSSATEAEVEKGRRGIASAHDLALGVGVTSGVVGFVAFAALGVAVLRRMRHAPPELGWAAGAAAAMAVFHLLQPPSAPLTPWLFLAAGIAAGRAPPGREPASPEREPEPEPEPGPGRGPRRWLHAGTGVALATTVAITALVLVASVLEQWGDTYASESALRASRTIAPGRITPVFPLATNLALDARSGDPDAGAEAKRLVREEAARHPYHPGIRLLGMQVWILLDDIPGAHAWLVEQVEVFPGDRASMPAGMIHFLETGELPGGFFGIPDEDEEDG